MGFSVDMSELFDAFDDEGLVDVETRTFLLEALENADPDDWHDILEPFVNPEAALKVLKSVPGVLERSRRALVTAEVIVEEQISLSCKVFLEVITKVCAASGVHTAARCVCINRTAKKNAAADATFWMHRAQNAASLWGFPQPTATFRESFFAML